jgi:hypothetical protein
MYNVNVCFDLKLYWVCFLGYVVDILATVVVARLIGVVWAY